MEGDRRLANTQLKTDAEDKNCQVQSTLTPDVKVLPQPSERRSQESFTVHAILLIIL